MPTPAKLRIAVLDDHEIARESMAELVDRWPHGQVVLQAKDGLDYEEQLATAGPIDLAIVDLFMLPRDGFETIARIREQQPDTLILAITFDPLPELVHRALVEGAHGVVGKVIGKTELYFALDALRTTGRYANELMMQQVTHVPDPGSPLALRKKVEATYF